MSAFMVDDGTIDYLVYAAASWEMRSVFTACGRRKLMSKDELGKTLLRANLVSMKTLYGNRLAQGELDAPKNYHFEEPKLPLEPEQVIASLRCLNYQCCEYEGWPKSVAHEIWDSLMVAANVEMDTKSDHLEEERLHWDIPRGASEFLVKGQW